MTVLSCGPKASSISGISAAISPRYIRRNPRSVYARVPHMMAQFILKNRKFAPYHRDSPNTRNGARLRSPSPIMAPGRTQHFPLEVLLTPLGHNQSDGSI